MTLIRSSVRFDRLAMAAFALALAACGSSASSTPALDLDGFGAKYKFEDGDLAGWKQSTEASSFELFSASNLSNKIDGPADNYVTHGCKYAMYQELVGPDPQICRLVAMDFVTETQAASMVTYQRDHASDITTIPGFDPSIAFGYPALTGTTVYANLKSLYLEVIIDGNPNKSSASEVGAQFLKLMEAKNK
jgi:hypothetical protein